MNATFNAPWCGLSGNPQLGLQPGSVRGRRLHPNDPQWAELRCIAASQTSHEAARSTTTSVTRTSRNSPLPPDELKAVTGSSDLACAVTYNGLTVTRQPEPRLGAVQHQENQHHPPRPYARTLETPSTKTRPVQPGMQQRCAGATVGMHAGVLETCSLVATSFTRITAGIREEFCRQRRLHLKYTTTFRLQRFGNTHHIPH